MSKSLNSRVFGQFDAGCNRDKWHLVIKHDENFDDIHQEINFYWKALTETISLIDSKMIPVACVNIPIKHFPYFRMVLHNRIVSYREGTSTVDIEIKSKYQITGRSVKVVAGGVFNRRKWFGMDAVETGIALWKEQIRVAKEVDLGADCDTIFMLNKSKDYQIYNDERYKDFLNYLEDQNNTSSFNGKIYCFVRENVGISYGAFSEVFGALEHRYDYWYFNEDDYVIDSPNRISSDISHLVDNFDLIGYVASSGVSQDYPAVEYPKHVHFAMGLTSRAVLREVCQSSVDGQLPFFNDKRNHDDVTDHERYGEVPFTNAIYNLGYDLVVTEDTSIFYEWNASVWGGHPRIRNHEK